VTGGSLVGPDVETDGATQDSRALKPGQLFVPLVADRDGHEFIADALAAGAAAYLTNSTVLGGSAILVEDTMAALRDIASAGRSQLDGHVVAITGSVGKTSTKDLLAGALRRTLRMHASEKSFNNEIGVPLTLLNAPDDSEVVVVEMGARGLGHVAFLCEVAAPEVGIVTTVAPAHTGEFGSVEAIAVAKGELIESLPSGGLAVLNGDNPLVLQMAARTEAQILTFGTSTSCDVFVMSSEVDDQLRVTFKLATDWGELTVRPTTRGAHMATNVAAAVGTALWLGVPIDAVGSGLGDAKISPWRMEVTTAASGATIINDAYNANPTSMRGALDSLAQLPQSRKIAIVGYMGELGPSERAEHESIADHIASLGVEMIPVGTALYGPEPVDEPIAAIEDAAPVDEDTAILVKGSRSGGLEKIAAALRSR